MRLLVVGGAGFIGSHLVGDSMQKGWHVTVCDRSAGSRGKLAGGVRAPHISVIARDINRPRICERLLKEHDVIVNLAARVSVRNRADTTVSTIRDSLGAATMLLDAARRFNPRALHIFMSSRRVYGRPETIPVRETDRLRPVQPYGIHKLLCEGIYRQYGQVFGIPYVILRATDIYGPRRYRLANQLNLVSRFVVDSMRIGRCILSGSGNVQRDFLYVSDLSDAIIKTIENFPRGNPTINIGSGTGVDVKTVIKHVAGILGGPKPRVEVRRNLRDHDFVADIGLARSTLNWCPQISIEDGIRRTVQYYNAHGAGPIRPVSGPRVRSDVR